MSRSYRYSRRLRKRGGNPCGATSASSYMVSNYGSTGNQLANSLRNNHVITSVSGQSAGRRRSRRRRR